MTPPLCLLTLWLLLGTWSGISSGAVATLPETLALEEAVLGLEDLSAFVLAQDLPLAYDRFANRIDLDTRTLPPAAAHDLLEQVLASPHIGHASYDPGGGLSFWLATTTHHVYIAPPTGRSRPRGLRILVGRPRHPRTPRAHWFGSPIACAQSLPQGRHEAYTHAITSWCTAPQGTPLALDTIDPRTLPQPSLLALEHLKFESNSPDAPRPAALLARAKHLPHLRGSLYLTQAFGHLERQDLPAALATLTMATPLLTFPRTPDPAPLHATLALLSQGTLERLLWAALDGSDDAQATTLAHRHRRLLKAPKPGLWRALAHAYRRTGRPAEGARWYEEMLGIGSLEKTMRLHVLGELATTYIEAGRAVRAKMVIEWMRQQGVALKEEAAWLPEWAHQQGCQGLEAPLAEACLMTPKPERAQVLDAVATWPGGVPWPRQIKSGQGIVVREH